MGYCCEAFAKEATSHKPFVGGGFLYPPPDEPIFQIEQDDDGTWAVNGCCGSRCHVLSNIKFCPFCGTKITAA